MKTQKNQQNLQLNWNQTTAILGGTFDPPHLGHRRLAAGLLKYPGFKQVLVMPSAQPPLKGNVTPVEHRMAMTKINFSPTAAFPYPGEIQLDLTEIERDQRSGGPSYTYDTLQELKARIPYLAFVVGVETLFEFERWHRFPDVLKLCHWLLIERRGTDPSWQQQLQNWHSGNLIRRQGDHYEITGSRMTLTVIPTDASLVSSTQIRETLELGRPIPQEALLPEVLAYIKEHGLYGGRG